MEVTTRILVKEKEVSRMEKVEVTTRSQEGITISEARNGRTKTEIVTEIEKKVAIGQKTVMEEDHGKNGDF